MTVCPGPHQPCRGCRGSGKIWESTSYTDKGEHMSALAPHQCRHCKGRAFFCRVGCSGEHTDDTPLVHAWKTPPN